MVAPQRFSWESLYNLNRFVKLVWIGLTCSNHGGGRVVCLPPTVSWRVLGLHFPLVLLASALFPVVPTAFLSLGPGSGLRSYRT